MLRGHGNDGRSGAEGVRRGNVIGTYLHGPLLPKNVWFADWLIATATGLPTPLAALDDRSRTQRTPRRGAPPGCERRARCRSMTPGLSDALPRSDLAPCDRTPVRAR